MKVCGFFIEEEIVVMMSFCVVFEFVVIEGEVVEVFVVVFGGGVEDVREEMDV